MKKNVFNLFVYLWFCIGGMYLIRERIIPIFGLIGLCIGIYNIILMYQKWYNSQLKMPFTPKEWKIIGRKIMEEEGVLSS